MCFAVFSRLRSACIDIVALSSCCVDHWSARFLLVVPFIPSFVWSVGRSIVCSFVRSCNCFLSVFDSPGMCASFPNSTLSVVFEQTEGEDKSRELKRLEAHNAGLTRELGQVDMSLMQALEDNGLTLDSVKLQNTPTSRRVSRRRQDVFSSRFFFFCRTSAYRFPFCVVLRVALSAAVLRCSRRDTTEQHR